MLILLGVGLALFIPVGSVLGFMAFQQRNAHSARIESLGHEVSELRREIEILRSSGGSNKQQPDGSLPAAEGLAYVQPPAPDPAPVPVAAKTEWAEEPGVERSEERRVGKECRSRWSPQQ